MQSLAQALFFASRGVGTVRKQDSDLVQPYSSTAHVILSGLGADELLGGYIRHKNAFKHEGWQGLLDEVRTSASDQEPLLNIHSYNLILIVSTLVIWVEMIGLFHPTGRRRVTLSSQ